jgi:hypothetical protein
MSILVHFSFAASAYISALLRTSPPSSPPLYVPSVREFHTNGSRWPYAYMDAQLHNMGQSCECVNVGTMAHHFR